MQQSDKLFYSVIKELDKATILQELVLIGGWCQKIYRINFGNPKGLSLLRTVDIDFLIPRSKKIQKEVDVPQILKKLGFDEIFSLLKGYTKYVHRELEVEFLVSDFGRGRDKPYPIKSLKINAQRLRYLDILERYITSIRFNDIEVKVPEPAAYVINKLIISDRRSNTLKKEKDLKAARELGEYLLENEEQRKKLKKIYDDLHANLKKRLLKVLLNVSVELYDFLK